MAGIYTWAIRLSYLSFALQMVVIYYLLSRRLWSVYPGLLAYISVNVLQGCLLLFLYWHWGYRDLRTARVAWGSEILSLSGRAWAIADICRLILGRYRGVWGLAWRLLSALACGLVVYSLASAGLVWDQAVLNANIGLELSAVMVLVALFLFARHYEIVASPAIRTLALGFFVYSSFTILNDKILQIRLGPYVPGWQVFATLPFIGSICLWIWAVRQPVAQAERELAVLPRDVYYTLTPEMNLRLRALNERLSRLWGHEEHRR